jgi:uncharacterized protein
VSVIKVKVKPNARTSELQVQDDGTWLACVKAPPADGLANAEMIALCAQKFQVPKRQVTIKSGAGSRFKRVEIEGIEI